MGNPKVFMDIEIGGVPVGRIGKNGKPLHYKGCNFSHGTSKTFVLVSGNNESIYGEPFDCDNLVKNPTGPGTLSMISSGRLNTNNSGFLICTSEVKGFDGRYVLFGEVVDGRMHLAHTISNVHEDFVKQVIIINCGDRAQ